MESEHNHTQIDSLVIQYQKDPNGETKTEIINATTNFVNFVARKFQYRGESIEDLRQIGTIGLLKAIENYNSFLGAKFLTYAASIIIGEIKHHFRDNSSIIKIPRKTHELYASIQTTIKTLSLQNKKAPTVLEVAKKMEISEEDILMCLTAAETYRSLSLDAPLETTTRPHKEKISLIEALNTLEIDISDTIINREGMKKAMEALNNKERKVVYFTYYLNLNQAQIASRMSCSQAHVSRILINALKKLKRALKR